MIHRFWSSDLGGGSHWNSMGNQGEKYTMSEENEGKIAASDKKHLFIVHEGKIMHFSS